jgi:hypothetical protein
MHWIPLVYLLSTAAALLLLYETGTRAWYWHVIGALCGLVIGLLPPPSRAGGDLFYVITGAAFMFLFTWGAIAILFSGVGFGRRKHRTREMSARQLR